MKNQLACPRCGASNQAGALYCSACGKTIDMSASHIVTAVDTDGRLYAGQVLHQRYAIVSLLGSGGMGAVYKALDRQFDDRIIAIKEMGQSRLSSEQVPMAIEQFKKEASLLASLTHPHLPRIYDYFSENQRWYLVMDYIEGQTLGKYLEQARNGTLSVGEALEIVIQLASVLDYLHTRPAPIIFRDLKPLNIMITPQRHVYLIDFGIARHFKPGKEQDTTPYLTFGYAAPEQFGQAQTTPRSDIYSLGVLLHHLLSGKRPQMNTTPFQFQPLQAYNPTIPPALSKFVQQMTEVYPEQRPATMAMVKQVLERIAYEYRQQSMEARSVRYTSPEDTTAPTFPSTALSNVHVAPPQFPVRQEAASVTPGKKRTLMVPIIVGVVLVLLVNVGALAWFLGNNAAHSNVIPTQPPANAKTTAATVPTTITTPPSTPATVPTSSSAIAYPSYTEAENDISYYYTNKSDFRGKNVIQHFDSITYGPFTGPADQPQFPACSEYQFAPVSSPNATQTARHTFTFQYSSGSWSVIDMGNWNSC